MNRNVWMCSLTAGVFSLTINVGLLLTPGFSTEILGATDAQVGILVAAPGILAMLLMIPSASLSGYFGHRRAMIASAIANITAACLYLTSASYAQVLGAQIVFGIANAFFWPANLTYLCEAAEPHRLQQAQAANTAAQGVGLVIGPVLAGSLAARLGYRGGVALWLLMALANLGLSLSLKALPKRRTGEALGTSIRWALQGIPAMLRNPRLVVAMCSQLLSAAFTNAIGGAFLILFVQDVGYTAFFASLMLSFREIFGTLARAIYPYIRRYVDNLTILGAAPMVTGMALLVIFVYPALPVLLCAVAAVGFALGIVAPAGNMEASQNAAPNRLAETIAVVVTMFQVGNVIFPSLTGLLVSSAGRKWGLMVASIFVMLLALWPLSLSLQENKKRERQVSL